MSSATAPTARPAATARTPTSAPGSSRGRARAAGFTLVELLMVLVLIALASGLIAMSIRDPAAQRLDQEGLRLSALLEAARAESRSSGRPVRFELASTPDAAAPFRFVGLPPGNDLPQRWLDPETSAEIIGARALVLGPEPLIGSQRIVLRLGSRNLTLATDGLAPFTPLEAAP